MQLLSELPLSRCAARLEPGDSNPLLIAKNTMLTLTLIFAAIVVVSARIDAAVGVERTAGAGPDRAVVTPTR